VVVELLMEFMFIELAFIMLWQLMELLAIISFIVWTMDCWLVLRRRVFFILDDHRREFCYRRIESF